ncbi:hypothetical protein K439DRAFT_1617841 [Ramaria rubella]|nr:hypothetical protein K439DRAFT_1617841 [Ramaria rubella]
MTSYLRRWWYGTTTSSEDPDLTTTTTTITTTAPVESLGVSLTGSSSQSAPASPIEPPVAVSISTPEESQDARDEDEKQVDDVDDDIAPAFPSLNSIQRTSVPKKSTQAKTGAGADDSTLMPPPAFPTSLASNSNDASVSNTYLSTSNTPNNIPSITMSPVSNTLRIPSGPRTASNTLQLPLTTTRAPPSPSKKSRKVALTPGHSPLDWAALKTSGQDLRGTSSLMRITPSQLKRHNKRNDAWSAFNGKVYNITPYLSFHPGGEKELMRVAGRDGTKLFALTHVWVNVEFMLDECMVGFLVPEPSSAA